MLLKIFISSVWYCYFPSQFVYAPACGSGVPEILAYLNGVVVHGTLNLKYFVVKFISLVFAVSSGLPAAIQGPVIAMG